MATVPPNPSVPQTLQTLTQISIIKLTCENYPLWCTIMVPYLEGHNVYGFVNGEISSPPRSITTSSNPTTSTAMVANPAYSSWYQQDKIVLTALISSLSDNILVHVAGLLTSRDVWVTLEKMFASQSKARTMQTRLQLATLKKGSMSISDFFQKAQTLAQSLAAVAEPLRFRTYILHSCWLESWIWLSCNHGYNTSWSYFDWRFIWLFANSWTAPWALPFCRWPLCFDSKCGSAQHLKCMHNSKKLFSSFRPIFRSWPW